MFFSEWGLKRVGLCSYQSETTKQILMQYVIVIFNVIVQSIESASPKEKGSL